MAGWNFFNIFRGNIVKWWRLVILPVFHLNNNDPKTPVPAKNADIQKESQEVQDTKKEAAKQDAPALAAKKKAKKDNSDTWWGEAMNNETEGDKDELFSINKYKASGKGDAMDILKRMELEKQKELEELRRKAEEQERINSILNANKTNVDEFIEEGRAGRGNTETLCSDAEAKEEISGGADLAALDKAQKQEEMRRAQEIIDRLNREAEEDEAKKAAEVEAAKAQVNKQA